MRWSFLHLTMCHVCWLPFSLPSSPINYSERWPNKMHCCLAWNYCFAQVWNHWQWWKTHIVQISQIRVLPSWAVMSFGAGVCAEVNRDAISSSHPNTHLPNYKQDLAVNHDGLPPLYSIKELIKAKLTIPNEHLNICQCDKSCLQWPTIFVFDLCIWHFFFCPSWYSIIESEECMTYTADNRKGLIKGFLFHFWGAFSFVPICSHPNNWQTDVFCICPWFTVQTINMSFFIPQIGSTSKWLGI